MRWCTFSAGALQLTLWIALIIVILLTSFIILLSTHRQFNMRSDIQIEVIRQTDAGFKAALTSNIPLEDSLTVVLPTSQKLKNHITLYLDYWGVFNRLYGFSSLKNASFHKTALIGTPKTANTHALYLENKSNPLVLVGNTIIQGDVFLPFAGIKAGNISGTSFTGKKPPVGNIKQSGELKPMPKQWIENLLKTQDFLPHIDNNQYLSYEEGMIAAQSFKSPLKVISSTLTITLGDCQLFGHIRIQSSSKIVVTSASILKDVVLVAPEIEIRNIVKGQFQAIASKRIKLGTQVKLAYPSALVVHNSKVSNSISESEDTLNTGIFIDKQSEVLGFVYFQDNHIDNRFQTQLLLDENSTIVGEVYSYGNMEIKGQVFGQVNSTNFISQHKGTKYRNHIFNGRIRIDKLPITYVGVFFETQNKSVAQWLY